jgi:hypothetical protein
MPEPTTTDDTTATGQTGVDDRASVSDEARGSEPRALTALLADSSIVLDAAAVDRDDAIRQAGAALIAAGDRLTSTSWRTRSSCCGSPTASSGTATR